MNEKFLPTANGDMERICDMEYSHINNYIKFLKRILEKRNKNLSNFTTCNVEYDTIKEIDIIEDSIKYLECEVFKRSLTYENRTERHYSCDYI